VADDVNTDVKISYFCDGANRFRLPRGALPDELAEPVDQGCCVVMIQSPSLIYPTSKDEDIYTGPLISDLRRGTL
jgi:hypothetical protein